jgi:hypothetical protein
MMPKFLQHPVANHLSLRRMMEHMDFPEGKQDFTIDEFQVQGRQDRDVPPP